MLNKHSVSEIKLASTPYRMSVMDMVINCSIHLLRVIEIRDENRSENFRIVFDTPSGRCLLDECDTEEAATSLYLGYTNDSVIEMSPLGDIIEHPPLSAGKIHGRS